MTKHPRLSPWSLSAPRALLLCASAAVAACGQPSLDGTSAVDPDSEPSFELQAVVGATYQVGPGKAYASLQAVAGKLQPGDVVEVFGGGAPYPGGVILSQAGTAAAPITIRGVAVGGQRPVLSGGSTTLEFRADHYVLQGFDVTGGTSRGLYHHAHNITIRDTVVHDCPGHGILGADYDSGSLTLDYVEVYRCGAGDSRHPIYIATDPTAHPGSVFRMMHSYVHDGNGGNNVKSRAERNEIYYNWIEGGYYRELELIGSEEHAYGLKREDSDVVGNVFVKRKGTYVARIGGDSDAGDTGGRYRFVNNTFLLAPGSAAAIQAFARVESLELHNNVFYRLGGGAVELLKDTDAVWVAGRRIVGGARNWLPAGSTGVPAELQGTLTGTDPGLPGAASNNLVPSSTSPLLNAGVTPVSPSGYAFPSPLPLPAQLPPAHALQAAGTALSRPVSGAIDLGAFEAGGAAPAPPPGNAAPQVSLTGPANGAVLMAPATVTLSASASDSDGAVTKVEFFANGQLVGSDTTAPYSVTISGAAAGAYHLTARATDDDGAQSTSAAVDVTVGSAPSCLTSSGTRQNLAFAARGGTFTAEADVTPSLASVDGAVSLSSGQQGAWKGLAAIVLFSPSGKILARNGASYAAAAAVPYSAGARYHLRLLVNVQSRSYSVYVTAPGRAEVLLGANYAFRSEQAGVSSLDSWDVRADLGSIQACNLSVR